MDCRPARTKNPDLWIEACPEISRPICELLREYILTWEPGLTEAIKWNMLCYSGQKLICAVGGYKKSAGLTFFRGRELPEAAILCDQGADNASLMSMRFPSMESVDPGPLRRLLHAAVRLDESVPPPKPARSEPRPLPEMPAIFATALKKNGTARAHFDSLSRSCQREYLIWIGTAKRPETQARRLAETMAALTAGRKWEHRKG